MRKFIHPFLAFPSIVFFLIIIGCKKEYREDRKEIEKITYEQLSKVYKEASSKLRSIYIERMGVSSASNIGIENETQISTLLTEEEAAQIVAPLYGPTASYLSQHYDIDLHEDIPPGDAKIAIIGGAVLRLEYLENVYNKTVDTLTMETNDVFSRISVESEPDFYDCALRAIGVNAAVELLNSGISNAAKATIRKKALRKMIKKVAVRTLGFIGAAVAIYELGDCMDWW